MLYRDFYDDTDICESCYKERYVTCCECDGIVDYEESESMNGNYYCPSCYHQQQNNIIHYYSYNPDPVFYGIGNRFFGVELEIDNGGGEEDDAKRIYEIANAIDEHIYIKNDGSLDEGFEIVTHPMTLDYHMNEMPWREILRKSIQMGYLSHKTSTCGLHIHVNRSSFGDTTSEQDDAIARIMYFFEAHWDKLLRFSRRTEDQMIRWADRYGYQKDPKGILDTAKKGKRGRYACINILNYATIEFRIFQGTLKYNTLIAALQLVDEVCKAAFSMSDEEMAALTWDDFVSSVKQDELLQYLEERHLRGGDI